MGHKESQRKWYLKNKEKINTYSRLRYSQNPEKIREYNRKWSSTPEQRLKKKIRLRKYRAILKEKVLKLLGGKCKRCGFSDVRALQIDHIKGNGKKEKLLITRLYSSEILESIAKKMNKYQLLCANCNWIKRVENKEFGRGGIV